MTAALVIAVVLLGAVLLSVSGTGGNANPPLPPGSRRPPPPPAPPPPDPPRPARGPSKGRPSCDSRCSVCGAEMSLHAQHGHFFPAGPR